MNAILSHAFLRYNHQVFPSSPFMRPKYIDLLTAVFITVLLVSNIVASKIGSFGGYFFPVGVIGFPVAYILSDILTEVYGFAAMRRAIWTGFFCNFIAVLFIYAAREIPAAPFYQSQAAFDTVLGATPRLLLASFIAYLIGSFANAVVLAKLKVKTNGRFLWLRTIGSTIVGEALDSAIFISIAFYGIIEPAQLYIIILTQWLFKCAFEILVTPLTYAIVSFLKRAEGIDHFDRTTRFSFFRF